MKAIQLLGVLTLLSGCVAAPPAYVAPPGPPQLVAYPGPGKTDTTFRADDVACQQEAVTPPAPGTALDARPDGAPATLTPGLRYLRCMVVHDNIVQPVATQNPAYYASYGRYPVFGYYNDYYPWLYGGGLYGFGYYRGYGYFNGYRGYGFRGGYGFRDGGYARGGFGGGFRGEGFRGEGFRGEGFRGGGFRGGQGGFAGRR